MKSLFVRYKSFLSGLETSEPNLLVIALARTALALGTLITLVFSSPAVLFDKETYGSMDFNQVFDYINLFHYIGFDHLHLYYGVCISILLLVLSGIYPRFTGVLHWMVAFSLFRSATILEGGDQITSILTLLLIPVTLCDGRSNHWNINALRKNQSYFIANISLFIIRMQMALLYFQSGVEKIYKLEEWKNGTAVYYFFNDPVFGYSDWIGEWFNTALLNAYVVTSLSWGTILFEIILFGAFFMRPINRKKLLIPAIVFHMGIALVLGLVSFFFAMTGGVLLYLSAKSTNNYIRRIVAESSLLFKKSRVHYASDKTLA